MRTKALVLVDDREPEGQTQRLQDFGLEAVSTRLETGDYQTFPHGLNVLIERKTISNALGSLATKQFQEQMQKMLAAGDLVVLFREGAFLRDGTGLLSYYRS